MSVLTMSSPISFVQGDDLSYTVNVTQSGLATRTTSSTTLVGSNTYWSSSMNGCNISFPDGFSTTIQSVTDSTHLVLAAAATTTDTVPVVYTAAVNITGYSIYFTVKRDLNVTNDSTALIALPPITQHLNPSQGISSIVLSHLVTNIYPGSYYYDVRVVDTNNSVMSVRYGQCTVYVALGQRVS